MMWGRLGIICAVALGLAGPAWALEPPPGWQHIVPQAGPLEGTVVESLPALGSPVLSDDGALPDITLPGYFLEHNQFAAAATAWETVAHATTQLPLKLQALVGAAAAYTAAGNTASALATYARIAKDFAGNDALASQRDAALLDAVWLEARTLGRITQHYNVPQAVALQGRLAALEKNLAARETRAGWLGFVPGLGHASVGQWRVGAVLLTMFSILAWAWLFALQRREWPYAVVWGALVLGLWSASPNLARGAAAETAVELRAAALASWTDLRPTE